MSDVHVHCQALNTNYNLKRSQCWTSDQLIILGFRIHSAKVSFIVPLRDLYHSVKVNGSFAQLHTRLSRPISRSQLFLIFWMICFPNRRRIVLFFGLTVNQEDILVWQSVAEKTSCKLRLLTRNRVACTIACSLAPRSGLLYRICECLRYCLCAGIRLFTSHGPRY